MALLYAVVCLMMWPYPQMVAQAGGGFGQVIHITEALALFTVVAALSTWLLQKRHPLWWLGQALLFVVFVALILFVLAQR